MGICTVRKGASFLRSHKALCVTVAIVMATFVIGARLLILVGQVRKQLRCKIRQEALFIPIFSLGIHQKS